MLHTGVDFLKQVLIMLDLMQLYTKGGGGGGGVGGDGGRKKGRGKKKKKKKKAWEFLSLA